MRPIPVRLTADQLAWLDSQLPGAGVSRSTAIRLCVSLAMAAGPLTLPTPARPQRTRRTNPAPEARS